MTLLSAIMKISLRLLHCVAPCRVACLILERHYSTFSVEKLVRKLV